MGILDAPGYSVRSGRAAERRRVCHKTRAMAANPVMPVPPTISVGGAGAGTTQLTGSTKSYVCNDPIFRFSTTPRLLQTFGGVQMCGPETVSLSGGARGASPAPWRVAFEIEDSAFEFLMYAGTATLFRLYVDEQPESAGWRTLGVADGLNHAVLVTFPGRERHRIVIEGSGDISASGPFKFGGVRHHLSGIMHTPTFGSPVRIRYVTDSIGEGASGPLYRGSAYPHVVSRLLGFDLSDNLLSWGGTGFLATNGGSRNTFRDRILSDIINYGDIPDILVLQCSINDGAFSDALVAAEIATTLDLIAAQLPTTKVIVLGAMRANGLVSPGDLTRAAIYSAPVIARGIPYLDAMYPFSGTGTVAVPNGGPGDYYCSSDGTHPSDAGANAIGHVGAPLIASVLGLPSVPAVGAELAQEASARVSGLAAKVSSSSTVTKRRSPQFFGSVVATTVFGATATATLNMYFPIPDDYASGDLVFRIRIQPSVADGLVALRKSVFRLRDGVAISTVESNTNIDITPANTLPLTISATVTAANFTAGDVIRMDFTRLGADVTDTMSNNVNYNGVWVEYTGKGF